MSAIGQERVLDALRRPAAYPHPTGEIRAVRTHVSMVFLAGIPVSTTGAKGAHFHVRIELSVPRKTLVVSRDPLPHMPNEDVYLATTEAFHEMRRQLQDFVRRRRGDVKTAARSPHARVDDLISTGGTIAAAADALRHAGCVLPLTALATHALMVGDAVDRLRAAGVARLVHSDSVPTRELPFPDVVVPLAPIAAAALREETPRS